MGSVKVAVRIRPFNSRENEMGAKVCLRMTKQGQTIITNPEDDKDKTFTFDYSYWSHDGYHVGDDGELIADNDMYATQRKVYDDLGAGVLDNAFEGYNSTLFAYGQTGSGKSFSMVGYGVNIGIVPIVANEMFKRVEASKDNKEVNYQVQLTMLEIYNECVRDLINPKANRPGGLKVRSKPGIGVYVEGLTPIAVSNFHEIESRMEEGTSNRTVGSTKMNATSSRAHTVVGIKFTTIAHDLDSGRSSEMQASMNLVDLAGSERAESTGATGDRLKEGCAINASLSALGNVISALADNAMGKKTFVPYRNSALTRILQDALGGNSKTVMIAALSPADVNYDETLGTLRYADRAKKIKNKVVKMENPTDKIIRQLKEENERLNAMLSQQGIDTSKPAEGESTEMETMRKRLEQENAIKLASQVEENAKIIAEMNKSWEQKMADAAALDSSANRGGATTKSAAKSSDDPFIINLHEDVMLAECVLYMFPNGDNYIGKGGDGLEDKVKIMIQGLNIKAEHALAATKDGKVTLHPLNMSKTFVNGDLITKPTELASGDRIIFGNNFVFRFEDGKKDAENPFDHAKAMDEFSTKQGLRLTQSLSGEMKKLEDEERSNFKAMEEKMKKMEAAMKADREKAQKALMEQQAMFAGVEMTPEQKAKMEELRASIETQDSDIADKLAAQKDANTKVLEAQAKRKRENKKLEAELAHIMPVINECNSMAEELGKPVRFSARLAIQDSTTDGEVDVPEANVKHVECVIRVTDQTNGNIWNWTHSKFDNRLYCMRDVYQNFQNFGPRDVPHAKDPFWDPPEAIEIGMAYVYLKALSQLVEVEADFELVDYKGEEQGQLTVEIVPEGLDGDELDYLTSADEIVGMDVVFSIKVPQAKNLPSKYANDVFIAFAFNGKKHETEAFEGASTNPKFAYEAKCEVKNITTKFKQYLLTDACVFTVRGFSELQNHAEMSGGSSGASARPHCNQCEEADADVHCNDCDKDFCNGCFDLLHKAARKKDHVKVDLGPAAGEKVLCDQCEEESATVKCSDCNSLLCAGCNALLHKSSKKKDHARTAIGGGAAEHKEMCAQCEEAAPTQKCEECTKSFCDDCNALLHKSDKKKDHKRTAL